MGEILTEKTIKKWYAEGLGMMFWNVQIVILISTASYKHTDVDSEAMKRGLNTCICALQDFIDCSLLFCLQCFP